MWCVVRGQETVLEAVREVVGEDAGSGSAGRCGNYEVTGMGLVRSEQDVNVVAVAQFSHAIGPKGE
jgi:hypothetical protein